VNALKNQFDQRGVTVAVVSFAQPGRLLRYQQFHNWPFLMLADPERIAYRAFSLDRLSWFQVFSFSTLRLYFRLLREGRKRQDYGKDDIYQAGGDFLLDRAGNILFAHRSKDPADRLPAAKLVGIIDRLDKLQAEKS
jgi:hypothetical protein